MEFSLNNTQENRGLLDEYYMCANVLSHPLISLYMSRKTVTTETCASIVEIRVYEAETEFVQF